MHGNRYQVRALDSGQRIISLEIDAIDEIDARQQAVARQLTLLSLRPASAVLKGFGARSAHSELNLLLFVQELHALVGAGLGPAELVVPPAGRPAAVTSHATSVWRFPRTSGGYRAIGGGHQ